MEYWHALDRLHERAEIWKNDDGTVTAKIDVANMTEAEVHSVVAKLMQATGIPVGVAVAMTSMASTVPDVPGLHRRMAMAVLGDREAMEALGLEGIGPGHIHWRVELYQSHARYRRPRIGASVSMLRGRAINIHWWDYCLKIGWPPESRVSRLLVRLGRLGRRSRAGATQDGMMGP